MNDPRILTLSKVLRFKVSLLASREPTADFFASQDCLLIATDHRAYDDDSIVRHAQLVVDTRYVTDGREMICKA